MDRRNNRSKSKEPNPTSRPSGINLPTQNKTILRLSVDSPALSQPVSPRGEADDRLKLNSKHSSKAMGGGASSVPTSPSLHPSTKVPAFDYSKNKGGGFYVK